MAVQITAEIAKLIKGLALRGADVERMAAFFQVDTDQIMAVLDHQMFPNVVAALGTELPRLKGTWQSLKVREQLKIAHTAIAAAYGLLDAE